MTNKITIRCKISSQPARTPMWTIRLPVSADCFCCFRLLCLYEYEYDDDAGAPTTKQRLLTLSSFNKNSCCSL